MSPAPANERTPLLPPPPSDPHSEVPVPAASSADAPRRATPARLTAPDALRGLLMALMCCDHANVHFSTFPHGTAIHGENAGEVVAQWTSGLGYWLRVGSHLCASGFAILLGLGLVYFVTSRAQRGWPARAQLAHLAKRALAILLVNEVTFLPMALGTPHLWLVNIILPALAVDYVLVGVVVVGLEYWAEPTLGRWFVRGSAVSADVREDGDEGPAKKDAASTWTPWLVDAALATLFFVAAFSTIWTAPTHGRCTDPPSSPLHETAAPWLSARCPVSPSVLAQLLYLGTLCPNLGFISVFPPLAWVSFVVLGVVYARVLLRAGLRERALEAFNLGLGVVFGLLFVSTRLLQYGNLSTGCLQTAAQRAQRPGANPYLADVKSFLYVTKYNPDPAFVFATSSATFLLLAFFSALFTLRTTAAPHTPWLRALPARALGALKAALLTLGIQALFFYALHQLLLSGLGAALRRVVPGWFVPRDPAVYPRPEGLGWGGYWVGWGVAMAISLRACGAFAGFKARRGPDSLWRFV